MKKQSFPNIKIITPSFNQGRFIKQTIESVLDQDYESITYVVVDGGSTDDTVITLKKYKQLSFVSEKDKGQTDALNKGIRMFSSHLHNDDIVAYINSDDYYLPGAFEKILRAFNTYPQAQWVIGDAVIVDEMGREIQPLIRLYKRVLRHFSFSLLLTNPYPQPSVFLRGAVLKSLGLFRTDLHYTMDYEYWMRVQKKYGQPVFVDACLSAFRIHGASKGGSQYKKQFSEELRVLREYVANPFWILCHKFHTTFILFFYDRLKHSL